MKERQLPRTLDTLSLTLSLSHSLTLTLSFPLSPSHSLTLSLSLSLFHNLTLSAGLHSPAESPAFGGSAFLLPGRHNLPGPLPREE